MSMAARHEAFAALHGAGCFVMPNPWDRGSARMMAAMGAVALATTSAGHAFTLGRPDGGTLSRAEALAHAADIVAAVGVPVSGDLEDGFGAAPEDVAETVRLAAEAGLSGCGIEDTDFGRAGAGAGAGGGGAVAHGFDLAVERIRAGAAAARALGRPFVLTARADGVMTGAYGLAEGIARLRAFEAAGAGCLYLPVPPGAAELRAVLGAVGAPVNALAAGPLRHVPLRDLAAMGVRRVSLGSQLARLTHAAIRDGMAGIAAGDFTPLIRGAGGEEIDAMLAKGAGL